MAGRGVYLNAFLIAIKRAACRPKREEHQMPAGALKGLLHADFD